MNRPGRVRALLAWSAVLFNVAGVVPLGVIEGVYRPDAIAEWVTSTQANPGAATASAALFTVGVLLALAWAATVEASTDNPLAVAGARIIAGGALLNAAATWAPAIVAGPLAALPDVAAVGAALLATSLFLDATFNGCLAVGLGLLAFGLDLPRALRGLLVVAALLAAPVALQGWLPWAADWLAIGGPAWLVAVTALGVVDWRRPAQAAS